MIDDVGDEGVCCAGRGEEEEDFPEDLRLHRNHHHHLHHDPSYLARDLQG